MTTTHELLCFGTRPGEGNAALVLLDDRRDEAARQAYAAASGRSACVFVDRGVDGIVLDYFYPHMRSPLCLHATLAAGHVLLGDTAGPLTVRTALRGQPLTLSRRDGGVFVALTAQASPAAALPDDLPRRLVPGIALVSPPALTSVGSPKLLLEVADPAALHALRPDLAAIHAWGRQAGVSGCYAWCRRPDGAFEGRNFNHLEPGREDSATGVAAGALTVLLGRPLDVYQGTNVGSPCLLRTVLDGAAILVGGAAAPAGEGLPL